MLCTCILEPATFITTVENLHYGTFERVHLWTVVNLGGYNILPGLDCFGDRNLLHPALCRRGLPGGANIEGRREGDETPGGKQDNSFEQSAKRFLLLLRS